MSWWTKAEAYGWFGCDTGDEFETPEQVRAYFDLAELASLGPYVLRTDEDGDPYLIDPAFEVPDDDACEPELRVYSWDLDAMAEDVIRAGRHCAAAWTRERREP